MPLAEDDMNDIEQVPRANQTRTENTILWELNGYSVKLNITFYKMHVMLLCLPRISFEQFSKMRVSITKGCRYFAADKSVLCIYYYLNMIYEK